MFSYTSNNRERLGLILLVTCSLSPNSAGTASCIRVVYALYMLYLFSMREKMGILKRSVIALSKMFSVVQRSGNIKKEVTLPFCTSNTLLDQNASAIPILLTNGRKRLNAMLYKLSKKSIRNAAC
jgi:hypothetical protein